MKKRLNFILLNGAMASGKSTIANLLQNKLDRTAILEIEDVRRLVTGADDNALAWKVIYGMCDEYLKNGVNVLLKQTVASADIVNKFLRLAKRHDCHILFYHFQAQRDELLKRIKQRRKNKKVPRTLIMSNIQKHEHINYRTATPINTQNMTANEVAQLILRNL